MLWQTRRTGYFCTLLSCSSQEKDELVWGKGPGLNRAFELLPLNVSASRTDHGPSMLPSPL